MRTWLMALLVAWTSGIAAAQEQPEPVMLDESTSEGSLSVSPDKGVAGEYGTWTVTYVVGAKGIAPGGGIRVELPDPWHSGPRNSAIRLQTVDPKADNYVTAKASREGVRVRAIVEHESDEELVKAPRPSLDGRYERFVFVVRVLVEEGSLQPGDTLSVVYGDTSGGSRGHRASAVDTRPMPILLALDEDGDNRFALHTDRPTLVAEPGRAVEMQFHAPSIASVGETLRLLITIVDKEYNPSYSSGTVTLECLAGEAEFPERIDIPAGKGYVEFSATAKAAGVLRLAARSADLNLEAKANPVDVKAGLPERRIYWGDTHSHTHYSWDGVGDDAYYYARNIAGLDYYAMTDHAMEPVEGRPRGLNTDLWKRYLEEVEAHNEPHRFVTIPAYECSLGAPYGHHNVYFRNEPGPLLYPQQVTLEELWKTLQAGDALTIPHHTGKFPRGVEFSVQNEDFRRSFEIYSGHGLSEAYDPTHPLAFEYSDFTSPAKSVVAPTYAQDVWMQGFMLSTIASSDDHRGHPGQPNFGLAAVMATDLTRDSVFQALYDRFTYGTTGSKIVFELTVDGTPMGQVAKPAQAPEVAVRALGTDVIDAVEVLRYQAPGDKFEVIKRWSPNELDFEDSFTDESYTAGAIYYARVRQKNTVRGRAVMAWSSPIWTAAP